MAINKIYKLRIETPDGCRSEFYDKAHAARKALLAKDALQNTHARIEVLEYMYKWQLMTMLQNIYAEGTLDGAMFAQDIIRSTNNEYRNHWNAPDHDDQSANDETRVAS